MSSEVYLYRGWSEGDCGVDMVVVYDLSSDRFYFKNVL